MFIVTDALSEITISEEKKKIQMLISNWLKEVTLKDKSFLKQLMDEISDNARARGLTPEILEQLKQ